MPSSVLRSSNEIYFTHRFSHANCQTSSVLCITNTKHLCSSFFVHQSNVALSTWKRFHRWKHTISWIPTFVNFSHDLERCANKHDRSVISCFSKNQTSNFRFFRRWRCNFFFWKYGDWQQKWVRSQWIPWWFHDRQMFPKFGCVLSWWNAKESCCNDLHNFDNILCFVNLMILQNSVDFSIISTQTKRGLQVINILLIFIINWKKFNVLKFVPNFKHTF